MKTATLAAIRRRLTTNARLGHARERAEVAGELVGEAVEGVDRARALRHVEAGRLGKVRWHGEAGNLVAVARHLDDEPGRRVEQVDVALRVDGLDRDRFRGRAGPLRLEVDAGRRERGREPAVAQDLARRRHEPDIGVDGQ